jgi:hypothetical protein
VASFSVARVPYYIAVAIFSALAALTAYWNNTLETGVLSDIYLAVLVASLCLCGASVLYMFTAKSGANDEVDLEVAGLQVGKNVYYIGVIVLALYRLGAGYVENHSGTGMQSTWGVMWLIASIGILLFTYANYRSYTAKLPAKPAQNPSSAWTQPR